jgi:hypothetical protein
MAAAVGAGAGQPNKDDQVKESGEISRVGFVASIVSSLNTRPFSESSSVRA